MRLPPPEDDAMKSYVTVGLSVLAGAALFEAALIPGMLIGGAVVLAPKHLLRPVVGAVAPAVGLSAFAFVVGPFVYLGHEKLWDYYGSPNERTLDPPTATNLLPAPA